MFQRSPKLLVVLLCIACDRGRATASASAASSTPAAEQQVDSTTPKVSEQRDDSTAAVPTNITATNARESDGPDSTDFEWTFAPRRPIDTNTRFAGRAIRRPNGVLKIWFDTATRATEEKPPGTIGVDSVTVKGLLHGEQFTTVCNKDPGFRDTQLVGVVRDKSGYLRPRLVWQMDTATNRIKSVSPEGISCTAAPEEGD
jgi:hypothetical protein